MNPVTHLLVNHVNHDAGPVVPPAVRRLSPFRRIRRLLGEPTYGRYLREP